MNKIPCVPGDVSGQIPSYWSPAPLAQFVKCTSHRDCVEKSTSDDKAYAMYGAINVVMRNLDEEGFSPY
ncbi:hypothetical protein G8F28_004264 [Salmonella enterica]|nr:hypothetical protein [Salmonella enterica]ELS9673815.1 hypothetical protein [Salmonella enterica]ELW7881197.1 hypothetical protein [Salmonella enterica]